VDEAIFNNTSSQARELSELFEQDSRRYSRALSEEQEAKSG
jgi:hypothetical protein